MEIIAKINEALKTCFKKNHNILSAENTNDINSQVQILIKREIPELLANYLEDSYNKRIYRCRKSN